MSRTVRNLGKFSQDRGNSLPFLCVNELTRSFSLPMPCCLLLTLLAAGCNQLNPPAAQEQDQLQVKVEEAFRLSDADNWLFRTPALWKVDGEPGRHYLQMGQVPKRPLLPGARRPQEYAIYTPYEFRSFALSCFVRVDRDATTRDACVIFGRQDSTHCYYVHLSALLSGSHNTIVRVDGTTCRPLVPADKKAKPVTMDRGWHKLDVLRNCDTGLIQVYVDARNADTPPSFEVKDKTYEWGSVAMGSFDAPCGFARILIEGEGRQLTHKPSIDEAVPTTAAAR